MTDQTPARDALLCAMENDGVIAARPAGAPTPQAAEPVAELRADMKGGGYVHWISDEVFEPGTKLYAAAPTFQQRIDPWLLACFGEAIARDTAERNHRFVEEALELAQACGCTASEAHQLVDYVFARPVGEKQQEVGGVMVTLGALCLAHGIDMHVAGETELARIWTKVEQIRAKQAAKPKHSPLPAAAPEDAAGQVVLTVGQIAGLCEAAWSLAEFETGEGEAAETEWMRYGTHVARSALALAASSRAQQGAPVAMELLQDLLYALGRARTFISNGRELGFIRMPDADTPDPAHETPGVIDAVIEKGRAALAGQQAGRAARSDDAVGAPPVDSGEQA